MITYKWYTDGAYWSGRSFDITLDQIAAATHSFLPLIVRTKEEQDYLHGMGLMLGVDFQPQLYKTWVPERRGPQGTYFAVEGLPTS